MQTKPNKIWIKLMERESPKEAYPARENRRQIFGFDLESNRRLSIDEYWSLYCTDEREAIATTTFENGKIP